MRPVIKQIESLKAENFRLKQMVERISRDSLSNSISSKHYFQSRIENLTGANQLLQKRITLFHVQTKKNKHHFANQATSVNGLENKNDTLTNQLMSFQQDNKLKKLTNQTLLIKLEIAQRRHAATKHAKNVLSHSLHQMDKDYQRLKKEVTLKNAFYYNETNKIKSDLINERIKIALKLGNKTTQTANDELKNIKTENDQLKSKVDEVLTNSGKKVVSIIKCGECRDMKQTSQMAINIPCGHMHCENCIQTWKTTHPHKPKPCPSCHGEVTNTIHVFA